jgi:hypothetical protein
MTFKIIRLLLVVAAVTIMGLEVQSTVYAQKIDPNGVSDELRSCLHSHPGFQFDGSVNPFREILMGMHNRLRGTRPRPERQGRRNQTPTGGPAARERAGVDAGSGRRLQRAGVDSATSLGRRRAGPEISLAQTRAKYRYLGVKAKIRGRTRRFGMWAVFWE